MISSQCIECENYLGGLFCPAFKDQIPQEILEGTFIHDKPHKDQVDDTVLYKPVLGELK